MSLARVLTALLVATSQQLPEPWPPLHQFNATGLPARPASLDPLVRYTWPGAPGPLMQTFTQRPSRVVAAQPAGAFSGLQSVLAGGALTVRGPASICLDFGVELAGWVEFHSPDLAQPSDLLVGIGEYTGTDKYAAPQAFGNGSFLACYHGPCPGAEQYGGVRFVWLTVTTDTQITVQNVTVVAQARPVSYTGSFVSSNPMLEKIWYQGAYGVRTNLHPSSLGSILYDRGDRKAFQGDNAIASEVAFVVFGAQVFPLVLANINSTDSGSKKGHDVHDSNLVPYPLYWVQTVCDYYWATNQTAAFGWFLDDMLDIVNSHAAVANDNWLEVELNFFGWDDRVRIGSGEKGYDVVGPYAGKEPQLAYVALLIQTCNYLAQSLQQAVPGSTQIGSIRQIGAHLSDQLRARVPPAVPGRHRLGCLKCCAEPLPDGTCCCRVDGCPPLPPSCPPSPPLDTADTAEYWEEYGVHAAANLALAEVPTTAELAKIAEHVFRDLPSICSYSPFNTNFILKGLARTPGGTAYATAAAEYCWSNMVEDGRGCFWENNSPMWGSFMHDGDKPPGNPSLCHPWSSGVTAFLSTHVLGVVALLPGHQVWAATPFVSQQLNVSGTVPTASGRIHLSASWSGTGLLSVELHAPTAGYLGLLREKIMARHWRLLSVVVDDQPLAAEDSTTPGLLSNGRLSASQLGEHRFTDLLAPGRHLIVARYDAPDPPASAPTNQLLRSLTPFPTINYRVNVSYDTDTRGVGWEATYGSSGWVLYGYSPNRTTGRAQTLAKLPEFIQNISWSLGSPDQILCVSRDCSCPLNDTRCLESPVSVSTPHRALGFAEGAGGIEIVSQLGAHYRVAIYFVAAQAFKNSSLTGPAPPQPPVPSHPAQFSLRVEDLSPGPGHLNPVAPSILVRDGLETGVWVVLESDRPLRIRLEAMYDDPSTGWQGGTFSAIAFH